MPFFLTHAKHSSSFSRPMSLEGYSVCVSEHSSDANADPVNIIIVTLHGHNCIKCICTYTYNHVHFVHVPAYVGVWARGGGGGGSIKVGSCRTNQNGAATGLQVQYDVQHSSILVGDKIAVIDRNTTRRQSTDTDSRWQKRFSPEFISDYF